MLTIRAKAIAGSDIDRAISDAISLAGRIGAYIDINFNGCLLHVSSFDTVSEKHKEYDQWIKRWRMHDAGTI
jgi:hypothetical protein